MHPFIKVLSLLVVISMLVSLNPERVILISVGLFSFLILKGRAYWQHIWQLCWRMKWLWISLLVLYGWFVPGSPMFITDLIPLALIPSQDGLTTGLLRALVLLNIISAVVLIMKSTSQEALIVSIMWLIYPFKMLKVDTGLFAARLVLTMDRVTDTEAEIRQSLKENEKTTPIVQRGIDAVASLLLRVEQHATTHSSVGVSLPRIETPSVIQWLIPLVLFVVLYLI